MSLLSSCCCCCVLLFVCPRPLIALPKIFLYFSMRGRKKNAPNKARVRAMNMHMPIHHHFDEPFGQHYVVPQLLVIAGHATSLHLHSPLPFCGGFPWTDCKGGDEERWLRKEKTRDAS